MIIVQSAPGGLSLSRDDGSIQPPLYVKTDELAALLADILEQAAELPAADAWDVYARLTGNEAA
jgi:hypothetical protein